MARPLKAVPDDQTQITVSLRMPAGLRQALEGEAEKADRNLSGEAERRLRRSFNPFELGPDAMDLLRGADGELLPASARPLLLLMLSRVFGREVAELTLKYAEHVHRSRQGARSESNVDVSDVRKALHYADGVQNADTVLIGNLKKRDK